MIKEPISTSEIVGGIRRGIIPDKPGRYFSFFKETIIEAEESIRNYRAMMYEKYGETREQYLEKIPPGAERKLAYELGDRYVRLFSIAHRHLMHHDLLIPENEKEKYRGQFIPVGLTPEEYRLWERGEL